MIICCIYRTRFEIYENGQVVAKVDLLLDNEKTVAVVEVKTKPDKHDIKRHETYANCAPVVF
jgi:hypothetical protein